MKKQPLSKAFAPILGIVAIFALLLICLASVLAAQAWVLTLTDPVTATVDTPTSEPAEVIQAEPEAINRLVFVNPSGQIGTIAPDGTTERLLTDDPERLYLFPAWAPDGSAIAAVSSDRAGGGVFSFQDVSIEDGGAATLLHQNEEASPFYLYWSPDSQQISFLANNPAGIGLHLVNSNGQTDSHLLTTGQPLYWQWTNDTNQLFIHTGAEGDSATLAFIDTIDAEEDRNLSRPGHFQAPGISADGQYLAFAELDDTDTRYVVTQNRQTGQRHQTEHAGLVALNWSPTRPQLAFTSPPQGAPFDGVSFGTLHLMEAETGDVRILSDEVVIGFFWSPDGQHIAYLTLNNGDEDITASRPGTTSKQQHQEEPPFHLNLWLVNIDNGLSTRLHTFEPTNLFVTQFLPFFDQYNLSHRLWSPDSTALVLPTLIDQTPQITIIPLNGNPPYPIAEGIISFWSHK